MRIQAAEMSFLHAGWLGAPLEIGEVFQACPTREEASGEDPGHAGETMSLGWPGNASGSPRKSWRKCLGSLSRVLDSATVTRESSSANHRAGPPDQFIQSGCVLFGYAAPPAYHSVKEDTGNHRLVKHLQKFAADVEGPQPP
ncbi:hypothetical protein L3Q82_010501 [Scortum barcoo]|uniref:Uncharacterized protein n=1 Tax=Scortum barcoo TaxID=214431 RepID=A0ACB8WBZ0_9TELE|nr:hypothetical protein L3Q82_010501 [Scortum barcoo]